MAERTLYSILEVNSEASAEAIKAAYDRLSNRLDATSGPGSEAALKLTAIKDAFFTLGNPAKRAAYDRRLEAQYTPPPPFWTLPKIALIAVMVLGGSGYYYKHTNDRARIEAEKQAAIAKAKESEEKARAEAEAERTRQDVVRAYSNALDAKRAKEREQDMRRFSAEQAAQDRQARAAADREKYAQQRADSQRDSQRRREEQQATLSAQQQLAREKAMLCQMERQRYGKSISCP